VSFAPVRVAIAEGVARAPGRRAIRMSRGGQAREPVRIVVAEPPSRRGPGSLGTPEALRRIGRGVRIEVVHDAESAIELARSGADLVVLDRALGAQADRVLSALRRSGPPIVIVTEEATADVALETFQAGAADCVTASDDYAEVLPGVALEQIRVWRARAARAAVRQRIRSLERLHAAIVDQFPAALAVLDAEGRVVTVNPEFERAFPSAASEASALADLLPADLLESADLPDLLARARAGAERAPRIARTRAGGRARAFDARAERLDPEGRLLLVLAEVTERERLAKNVRDLRSYLENILQNMASGLVVVDDTGRIAVANRTAEQILGEPDGGLRGRPVAEWFGAAAAHDGCIARSLREGARVQGVEGVVTRADGRSVPVAISSSPLVDADGTRLGAVVIFPDVSALVQLQSQVLHAEKMASLGRLAAGVAHEINNPMGFVHANLAQMEEYVGDVAKLLDAARQGPERFAALARDLDADTLLQDFSQAIRESQEGSERIRHIVQDLRAFAHRDDGEWVDADLNRCVDSTAHIVWTMMKHCVVLRKEYGALPPVRCHPKQLEQVFMNLLVNAYQAIEARASRDGGTGEIVVRTAAQDDGVRVAVEDDGVGIAPEHAARIFEPFFTTKEVGEGTGLGLSTSFEIVRRHGGSIRALARPGGGTVFEVWLPKDGGSRA
jgi:two-component system NtrC family sensor kinase